MEIHVQELQKLSEDNNSYSKNIIDIFLAAINDWPKPILTLDDYEIQVRKFIKKEKKITLKVV